MIVFTLLLTPLLTWNHVECLEIESLVMPSYVVSGDSAVMSCYYSVPGDRLQARDLTHKHKKFQIKQRKKIFSGSMVFHERGLLF